MRRPILLRLFLALGAARYSRAFGFGSGNYETDFYRRYDFSAEEAPSPVNSENDDSAVIHEAPRHEPPSTDVISRDPQKSSGPADTDCDLERHTEADV